MAYEVYQRTGVRVETPALSFTPDGRIALNSAAVRLFSEAGLRAVILLWDKSSNKLGLKAVPKSDKNSYVVSMAKGKHSGSLRTKTFFDYIGLKIQKRTTLSATWNPFEKMFEVTLPQEYLGSKNRGESERKA